MLHHIVATIRIADDVDAPKKNGVRSGYSPHHKFESVDHLVSGVHTYANDHLHYPGETLETRISYPSWEYFKDAVKVGDSFDVLELDRLVGYGKVDRIL
ncbi:hypothetical protein [Pandoraea sp. ISTKB]|uniref:hypothetical protein n=1 Tax=Pandoraea sp. ISTKB TaxID=1586708 RepID=UPI00084630C5|nr:hypothetical protein [Pandoraea sp. ISTKB]ODP30924.1 hypothetical protein A9762_27485 [Pandoraea sp. ISTKB]